MAGVVTAMLSLFVVLLLTPFLRYMPKSVMAAIIIVAVGFKPIWLNLSALVGICRMARTYAKSK